MGIVLWCVAGWAIVSVAAGITLGRGIAAADKAEGVDLDAHRVREFHAAVTRHD